jgi:rhamnosyltransferase subunit B
VLAHVNSRRGALELGAVDTAAHVEPYVVRHVAAFPSWFGPPRPGWPEPLTYVGFPLPEEPEEPPPALTNFVQENGAPLVFTPGTGSCDVSTFSRAAVECCRELSLPGVLLSQCNPPEAVQADGLLELPYVPLSSVLRHARSLVHHGGIGTIARALQAGVPQVISPFEFDQPQNGARVTELGAGATLARSELMGRPLAALIQRLSDDAGLEARLAGLSARIDGAAAVSRWADAVTEP